MDILICILDNHCYNYYDNTFTLYSELIRCWSSIDFLQVFPVS